VKKLNPDSNSLVPYKSANLEKLNTSVEVTEKLLYERAEFYFNKGFISLNSRTLDHPSINFSREILNDPQFLAKNKLTCEAKNYPEDYLAAVDFFSQAIFSFERYALAYNFRGFARFELKQYEGAIEDFTRAIEIDPDFPNAHYNRGVAYSYLNEFEKAIDDYTKEIAIDPNFALAYNNRGIACYNLKKYREAIVDFTNALAIDPNFAFAYNNRGVAKCDLKQYLDAIEDFTTASKLTRPTVMLTKTAQMPQKNFTNGVMMTSKMEQNSGEKK
jgi:tetratricopeptide (TPR) repeat protein